MRRVHGLPPVSDSGVRAIVVEAVLVKAEGQER
jgi:hypothetical protein